MLTEGKASALRKLIVLLPIPLLWIAFSMAPGLHDYFRPLENLAMNWRFRARGPVEVPEVKIVYANIDAATIGQWGQQPWPRSYYAELIQELFELGKVRAVGLDLVLSPLTFSPMVTFEAIQYNDLALAQVVDQYPSLVLAANYSRMNMPLTLQQRAIDQTEEAVELRPRIFPYRYMDILPEDAYPESPTFPIVGLEHMTRGQVGFIDWNNERNRDPSPRWIPLFGDTSGPNLFLDQLDGMLKFHRIPYQNFGDPETEADMLRYEREGFYVQFGDFIQLFGPGNQPLNSIEPYEREFRFYAFSIELALKYLGLGHDQVSVENDRLIVRDRGGEAVIDAPLTDGQEIEINWFSRWYDTEAGNGLENRYNPQVSIARISQQIFNYRNGDGEIKADAEAFLSQFEDAVVLIGPEDQLLQDLAPTPFDDEEVPKVSLHGNALKTLITGKYINRLGPWGNLAAILLLTPVVTLLGMHTGRYSLMAKAASVLVAVGYVVFVFGAFIAAHLVIPLIAPMGAAASTVTLGVIYQLLSEEKARGRIKGMFGTYLSPELVNRMVESGEEPKLGGEQVEITAFFSDVQGFSGFSEKLSPEDLVLLMNEYLGSMTEILEDEGGTLDKYIGDAIVALFNAPITIEQHAFHACKAALLMQQRQAELRDKWAAEGERWPNIVSKMQTRIGLNTGPATVGNMGSEKRFNYTMMGDTVNLAARCESGAKSAGVYTLATRETVEQALAFSNEVVFRFVDKWQVKGRSQPADMFELVCLRADMDDEVERCLTTYSKALDAYFRQDFATAVVLFEEALLLEPNRPERNPYAPTTPSQVMLERSRHYQVNPPGEDWDGVYVMTTK